MKTTVLVLAAACVLPSMAQAPAPSDATAFALALHRRLADGSNFMASPYSLRQALGMAYAGSSGKTRAEMGRVMSAGPGFLEEEEALRRSLEEADGEATLQVANAMFLKKGYEFLPSFLTTVKKAFAAETFVRDFGPAALKELNGWVAKVTRDKIKTILSELKPLDRAVLLNAVYFKGRWLHAFPKQKRRAGGPLPETFHPAKAKAHAIELMSVSKSFRYSEEGAFQAVSLPYKGGRLSMLVVLPAESSSLPALRDTLDSASWRKLHARLRPRKGLVAIPRLKFEKTIDMVGPLRAMGMALPFDSGRADFSAMSRPKNPADELYISRVVQKTFVEVNEEGTEAAAATAVVMATRGASMSEDEPFRFIANRPFLFAIEDQKTGAILFLGEVQDPL